jgi:hypothetical protein
LTNFDEMVHNSLEAEWVFEKAIREGSTAFDRKRGNLSDRHQDKLKPKVTLLKGKQTSIPNTFPTCKKFGKAYWENVGWVPILVLHAIKQDTMWQIVHMGGTNVRVWIPL